MSDLPPLPVLPPGRYRHYKGQPYQVVELCRHSETQEVLVLYRQLYGDGALWVRPYAMFVEDVVVDGKSMARFAPDPDPR